MLLLIKLALIIAGIIHLLPLGGVLGADRLLSLYGVALDDPNLVLLMRHRAVLFGMLGAYLIAAAFVSHLRASAFLLGLCSVLSFLALAWGGHSWNAGIQRVVIADLVALLLLLAGGIAFVKRGG
jgi:hypothetical protein